MICTRFPPRTVSSGHCNRCFDEGNESSVRADADGIVGELSFRAIGIEILRKTASLRGKIKDRDAVKLLLNVSSPLGHADNGISSGSINLQALAAYFPTSTATPFLLTMRGRTGSSRSGGRRVVAARLSASGMG